MLKCLASRRPLSIRRKPGRRNPVHQLRLETLEDRLVPTAMYGNFELVALEGQTLVHYWRDNSAADLPWQRAETIRA